MENEKIRIGTPLKFRRRNNGFTLIELLVVITIIIVLAALILVMTRRMKLKALQANAISSLRQVAAINYEYSTENNGNINVLTQEGDQTNGPLPVSDTYWGRLQPYLFPSLQTTDQIQLAKNLKMNLDRLFNSSDSAKMKNTALSRAPIYKDSSGLPVPFAFNTNLHDPQKFLKIGSFRDPSRVLYQFYGYEYFDLQDGKTYVPMPTGSSKPSIHIYYMEDRTALAAYLDGHVDSISPPIPVWKFK